MGEGRGDVRGEKGEEIGEEMREKRVRSVGSLGERRWCKGR